MMNVVGMEWVMPGLFECSGYGLGHAWVTDDGLKPPRSISAVCI